LLREQALALLMWIPHGSTVPPVSSTGKLGLH